MRYALIAGFIALLIIIFSVYVVNDQNDVLTSHIPMADTLPVLDDQQHIKQDTTPTVTQASKIPHIQTQPVIILPDTVPAIKNDAIKNNDILNKNIIDNIITPTRKPNIKNSITNVSTIIKPGKKPKTSDKKSTYSQEDTQDFAKILFEHVKYDRKNSSKKIAKRTTGKKTLELYNLNTGERLKVTFWENGRFISRGVKQLDKFMRDWRRERTIKMDRELYILLHDLYKRVGGKDAIHLISGHRSKKTNDALRAMGRNTAKKSQHVLGKAADIAIPNVALSKLRREALKMKRGGVGYYPRSGFVHVDTGPVRQW